MESRMTTLSYAPRAVPTFAAAITRGADGHGLLLDTLHHNAAEAEITIR
jgi:hypothetical protein